MDTEKMWEVIDLVIHENVDSNEALSSCGGTSVKLTYFSIRDNVLLRSVKYLESATLCLMSIPALRLFIKEVIDTMKCDAERA